MVMPLSGLWSLASGKNLARSVSLSFALRLLAALTYMLAGLERQRRCPFWFPGVHTGLSSLNDAVRRGRFV